MNAQERNDSEFAHRGQVIHLDPVPGREYRPGEAIHIRHRRIADWLMPAHVVAIDACGGLVISPGAAVKYPGNWHIDSVPIGDAVPQFDLFAGV